MSLRYRIVRFYCLSWQKWGLVTASRWISKRAGVAGGPSYREATGGWPTQAVFWLEWGSLRGVNWPGALGTEAISAPKDIYLGMDSVAPRKSEDRRVIS